MIWDEERTATLKRLWAEGQSTTAVARALGGVSREAVAGKINRLRKTGEINEPRRSTNAPGRPRRVRSEGPTYALQEPQFHRGGRAVFERLKVTEEAQRAVAALRTGECRWPIGETTEGPFRFCCAQTERTYCDEHWRAAYQPPRERRRGTSESNRPVNFARGR